MSSYFPIMNALIDSLANRFIDVENAFVTDKPSHCIDILIAFLGFSSSVQFSEHRCCHFLQTSSIAFLKSSLASLISPEAYNQHLLQRLSRNLIGFWILDGAIAYKPKQHSHLPTNQIHLSLSSYQSTLTTMSHNQEKAPNDVEHETSNPSTLSKEDYHAITTSLQEDESAAQTLHEAGFEAQSKRQDSRRCTFNSYILMGDRLFLTLPTHSGWTSTLASERIVSV